MKEKRQLIGEVVSTKMNKTIIVKVDRKFPHKVYKKLITRSKKYYVHDPKGECKAGDTVSILECRPTSKLKRWRLKQIEEKAIQT